MKVTIDILMIAAICVFIIDLSGFVESVKDGIGRWLKIKVGSIKPFDCSLCVTFWVGLIWLFCTGQFYLQNILVVCMMAFCTIPIKELMMTIKELILALLRLLNSWIDRI